MWNVQVRVDTSANMPQDNVACHHLAYIFRCWLFDCACRFSSIFQLIFIGPNESKAQLVKYFVNNFYYFNVRQFCGNCGNCGNCSKRKSAHFPTWLQLLFMLFLLVYFYRGQNLCQVPGAKDRARRTKDEERRTKDGMRSLAHTSGTSTSDLTWLETPENLATLVLPLAFSLSIFFTLERGRSSTPRCLR